MSERIIPEIPDQGEKIRLIIDTDAANEIDDLYAMALALMSPDRFIIEGFTSTHYESGASMSIENSYNRILELLEVANMSGQYSVKMGAHPLQYLDVPTKAEAVDFIIDRAHKGSSENPLWIVAIGASTNLASALIQDPSISDKVRYVFHARSSATWPVRSLQSNVRADIKAARTLLESNVPLVWFDTGDNLKISFKDTENTIAKTGSLGNFLHKFRERRDFWLTMDKGFFDLGDVALLVDPELCSIEYVDAPSMDGFGFFSQSANNGKIMRVFDINNEGTWRLLQEKLEKYSIG